MIFTGSLKNTCGKSVVLSKGDQVLVLRMDTSLVKNEDALPHIVASNKIFVAYRRFFAHSLLEKVRFLHVHSEKLSLRF